MKKQNKLTLHRLQVGMLLLCSSAATMAQTVPDTLDAFSRHLQLSEVTVVGLTGETKLKCSPAPVSIVDAKELHSAAATNIIDAISRQPGVAQITTGSGISKPVIRGLGYNRIVTVGDGVRQEGQQWGDEHGIEIDGEGVSSVEILKGPASLMYGSDAMAGVLVLRPQPIADKGTLNGHVSTEYQTNNGLYDYSLNMNGRHDWLVWDARFTDKHAHAYKNPRDGYVPGSQFGERAGALMIGAEARWGHSRLTWKAYHLTPGIIEGERDEQTGQLIASARRKTYSKTLPFQQVKHYKAVWDNLLRMGTAGTLKAIFGYQQNRRQEYEEDAHEEELYFRLHTLTYDLKWLSEEINRWNLTAGVGGMWQRSQNLAEETLIPAYHLFDFGIFATASRPLSWLDTSAQKDRLHVSGGVRADTRHLCFNGLRRDFSSVTGSLGTVFHALPQLNVRLNLSRGYRAPNMSELGADGVHEGTVRYEIGNDALKPEHSLQIDLGADYNSAILTAQVALFANRISNYIFAHRINQVVEEGYLTYEYAQGDARLWGFEAGIDLHPVHRIHLGNTFSYVNAVQRRQPADTKYLPLTPAPRWTADVKYELSHGGRHFNNAYVSVGMEHCFKQNHYYRADNTETATPSYTLVNLSGGTDLLFGKRKVAEVYITVSNLFNCAYQNHLSRLKYTDVNVVTGRQGIYNMGRNITLKLRVPFKLIDHS